MELVTPERAAEFDVFVMYDMPGVHFTRSDPPVEFSDPPPGYKQAFRELLDRGKGMVFLHHAVAGWPLWPEYADIIGARFHYQPGVFRGSQLPDSGYRHDVTHTVEVIDPDHPICEGLDPRFDITDEVYLFTVAEDDVHPLMRSCHCFVDTEFYSADRAARGEMYSNAGWNHPQGSNLVAWTRTVGQSPVVYIQFGDGPQTYCDPRYRRVIGNAIKWAGSGSPCSTRT